MSKTIEEIRNDVVIDFGYKNLAQLLAYNDSCIVDIINRVAKRYAQSQTQELTAWKESASKVFKNLDLQAIGKTLGIGLGEDVSVNALPKIKELQEQNAELVKVLMDVNRIPKLNDSRWTEIIHEEVSEILTKYNHLKQK